jgi:hypothetical protein
MTSLRCPNALLLTDLKILELTHIKLAGTQDAFTLA